MWERIVMTARTTALSMRPTIGAICIVNLLCVNPSFSDDTTLNEALVERIQGQSENRDSAIPQGGNPTRSYDVAYNANWARLAFGGFKEEDRDRVVIIHEDVKGNTKIARNSAGGPIRLAGRTYDRGIGVNSHSVLRVLLTRPAERFIADIGLDRNVDNTIASVAFHVQVNGKDVFATDTMKPTGEARSIDVRLNGARSFDLVVDVGGDTRGFDQGDWADARVLLQDGSVLWLDDLLGTEQSASGFPFSFVYGGVHSSDFIDTWKMETRDEIVDKTKTRRILTLTDPLTSLEVSAEVTIYNDTAGVDWILYFTNKGKSDTPIIEQVKTVDVSFKRDRMGMFTGAVLHRMTGCTASSWYNLTDWLPIVEPLRRPNGEKIEFENQGTGAAFAASPFFNLQWAGGGVITAIGWTGHWGGSVSRSKDGILAIEAGMRDMHLKLHPGESIRSPRILQLFWFGNDVDRGYNLFRQTMLKHIMPRIDGKVVTPPIAYCSSSFRESATTTEAIEMDYLEAAKGLGFEYFWMDAWWQKDGYPAGIGNYGLPVERCSDPVRFPSGLRPLSDAIHNEKMKFIVWFGNESCHPGTYLREEFPEWMLSNADAGRADSILGMPTNSGHATFNLGIPEAREYMTDYLNAVIKAYDIDCYRNDSGPIYEYFLHEERNTPDRRGMTEIRYAEGFYQMWDDLLSANPNLILDNCCGGGTRIDLETASRSTSIWRTDGTQFPIWENNHEQAAIQNQAMSASLNRYIPFYTSGQMGVTPYLFRSGFNAGISFNDDIRPKDYPREQLKLAIAEGKRIRKYFFGNFYPFIGLDIDPKNWCVMQYHRPAECDGLIMAFRRSQSPHDNFVCSLRETDENALYSVRISPDFIQGEPVTMEGSELKRLKIVINKVPGSVVVEYKVVRHNTRKRGQKNDAVL